MTGTKEAVLSLLWELQGKYLSGEVVARRLGVSRAAVWKAVEQLRKDGYRIESITNRGYRLSVMGDVLSAAGIKKYLRHPQVRVRVEPCVTSTNIILKELAEQGEEEGLALVAGRQTAGRGRRGRSFYSPADTGVYLSLLLRPGTEAGKSAALTAMAAVAAAEAIESLSGKPTQIKWVNDILMDGKKVCGILTEAAVNWESGAVNYAVIGIGINIHTPQDDFPPELRDVAGAAFGAQHVPELRCRLAAAVLDGLMDGYSHPGDRLCYEAYRQRSAVLGKPVHILVPGRAPVAAQAVDLDEEFALIVRYEDGRIGRLNSGEVSVRAQ